MQLRFILIILTACIQPVNAQLISSLDYAFLEANNVRVKVNNSASQFWDYNEAGYECPKNSYRHSIFCIGFMMVARDEQNVSHFSIARYIPESPQAFISGPVAASYTSAYDNRYLRVWKVTMTEIVQHQLHYSQASYQMPDAIADWPANGNVQNGEPAQMAPFADLNGNELYEPADGEYPVIPGDEAVFFMLNDKRSFRPEALGVDVYGLAYQINDPSLPSVHNTTFLSLKLVNRSLRSYHDLRFGLFADGDLGCYSNDYIGCDTVLDCFYQYNAASVDACGPGGFNPNEYIETKVAQSAVFLNRPMHSFVHFTNNGEACCDENVNQISLEYVLNGLWNDATPITVGGTGWGGVLPTHFTYFSNPNDTSGWSEVTANNDPDDRRGLGGTYLGAFPTGSSHCIDLGFNTALDESGTYNQNTIVNKLLQQTGQLRGYYNTHLNGCYLQATDVAEKQVAGILSVWPNPATNRLHITSPNDADGLLRVFDMNGRLLLTATTQTLDVSALSAGCYLLRWSSLSGIANQYARFVKE